VRYFAAPLLVLTAVTAMAAPAMAAPAYVSDELVLGLYAEPNNQGQRLATLHSGANLETLGVSGEFTQVRLNDGTAGWVKSAYLTTQEPATVRVKRLEEELDRSRATTPALAEAAARSEVEQLKRELANKQSEIDAVRGASAAPEPAPGATPQAAGMAATGSGAPGGILASIAAANPGYLWIGGAAMLAVLAFGFWLGYASLARRIRHKFGGLKVY
jgi:hypothetical protein